MIKKLQINCQCGLLGLMIGTQNFDSDGRQQVKFQCGCLSPTPDWNNPYQQS